MITMIWRPRRDLNPCYRRERKRAKERLAALNLLTRDAFEARLYDRDVFSEGGADE
jgi:hypothetical protein